MVLISLSIKFAQTWSTDWPKTKHGNSGVWSCRVWAAWTEHGKQYEMVQWGLIYVIRQIMLHGAWCEKVNNMMVSLNAKFWTNKNQRTTEIHQTQGPHLLITQIWWLFHTIFNSLALCHLVMINYEGKLKVRAGVKCVIFVGPYILVFYNPRFISAVCVEWDSFVKSDKKWIWLIRQSAKRQWMIVL